MMLARKRDYPIIRLLIGSFYALAVLLLTGGVGSGVYLWLRAEAESSGDLRSWPVPGVLNTYSPGDLCLAAAVFAVAGMMGFLLFGSFGQLLAMQRDRSINASLQVQLLEDILEMNEEAALAAHGTRVELCEGCGRLGSLHRIESGQWVCRDCRRQLRSA
jgi:hypothetical protein